MYLSLLAGLLNILMGTSMLIEILGRDINIDDNMMLFWTSVALLSLSGISYLFTSYCYRQYPGRADMSREMRFIFVILRNATSIHLLATAGVLVYGTHDTFFSGSYPADFSEAVLTLAAFGVYFLLHLLLVIKQYQFLPYVRREDQRKLNKLIEDIGQ